MPGDQQTVKSDGPVAGPSGGAPPSADAVHAPGMQERGPGGDVAADAVTEWSSPTHLWQVPTALVSVVLIAWGLYVGARPAAPQDLDAALSKVESLLAAGDIEAAAARIRGVIEPNLEHATESQQARFHGTVADFLAYSMQVRGVDDDAMNARIAEHYAKSVELGTALSAAQYERWAEALLDVGQLDAARERLTEIDRRMTVERDAAVAGDFTAVRNRIFRRLLEARMARADGTFEQLMQTLADYRLHRDIAAADEVWAIARQTELRLTHGMARQAVDLLLVEMRRMESRGRAGDPPPSRAIGELYVLLGQAYFELGEYARAQTHLEQALTLFDGPEPPRGDALALLGHIALTTGSPETALDHFQVVVRDFITTRSYLPGLLGRAEVHSILGDHEASMADYRALCEQVPKIGDRFGVSARRVAANLCDRHDAALALGKLDRALDFVELAETLFEPDDVPASVLFRLASSNRQIADDLIAAARGPADETSGWRPPRIDPAIRREANARFERAGEYFLRHFDADLSVLGNGSEEAAVSLWLAADSFDRGGRADVAIAHFSKYLGMQPFDDPRRADTLFRLAQAHHATLDFENAIRQYEQVIADRGRSAFAARSYVPLARCYVAMQRVPEARHLLRHVLSGQRLLMPDARDYRDALLELGRIEYHARAYTAAIESLTEFIVRYSNDPRVLEARYMLGDSYRANALALAERAKDDASLSPSEIGRLNTISAEQLQFAQDHFAQVSGRSMGAGDVSATDADLIRRAALYRADCAFHLGQFAQAIDLYDQAARQFSAHHSSMYALIQIVNCYSALGDSERASAAHHRALVRLQQLPDDVFAAPDSLMDRTAWERWLENNPIGQRSIAAAGRNEN